MATSPSFSKSVAGFVESGCGAPNRRFATSEDAAETDVETKDRRVVLGNTIYYFNLI